MRAFVEYLFPLKGACHAPVQSGRSSCANLYRVKAFLSLLLFFWITPAFSQDEFRVRRIYIRSLNVFDETHSEFSSRIFQIANKLHIKTRESFIRKELILKEGDRFDPDLLRESERNLRRYAFLTEVSVDAKQINEREVDLYVSTEDQWTTQVNLSFGSTRGQRAYALGFGEENFLGLGKKFTVNYDRNSERTTYGGAYVDPRFLNTRFRLNLRLYDATDGHHLSGAIIRPFFSQDNTWSYTIQSDDLKKTTHLYFEGIDAAELDLHSQATNVAFTRAWGKRYQKYRAGLSIGFFELLYPGEPRILNDAGFEEEIQANLNPPERRVWNFGVRLDRDWQRYERYYFLDRYGRTEDLPSGLLSGISMTLSQDQLGSDFITTGLDARFSRAISSSQYFVSFAGFSVRRESGEWNNLLADLWAHYYLQTGSRSMGVFQSPKQTLACNLSAILSSDMDAPFQLSLGEDEGLRGYTFKGFTGRNRVLMNLEERILTPWENRLAAFGIAPFMDAGYVWTRGGTSHTGLSAGIGLRLGFKKYGRTRVFRIDFAYPLIQARNHGLSISFAAGQIFDVL